MPVYDWKCSACPFEEEAFVETWRDLRSCELCSAPMEKVWSLSAEHRAASGYPYITKNITGEAIEVKSPGHERELCKLHGVNKRDDKAWENQEYLGWDPKARRQRYKEGNGVGTPGCWV